MRKLVCAALVVALGFASSAVAQEVYFSGSVTSSDYSPAGLDLGKSGYWFAAFGRTTGNNALPPTQDAVDGLPGFVTQTFGDGVDGSGGWANYRTLTLPNGVSGRSGALEINNAPNNFAGKQEEYMTLTFGAGVPNKLRLGVVIDNSDGLQFSNREILVNDVSTGTLVNDLVPDVKFFDLINVTAGSSVRIDGITSTGSVSHLGGILLDPLRTIDLEVNTTTGFVRIIAPDDAPLNINGYAISSASGALRPAQWTSLESVLGNGIPDDGIGWEKLGSGLATKVGEFNLTGSSMFGPGGIATQSLGSLFTPGGTEDLQLQFTLDGGTLLHGAVTYVTGGAVPGDYNGNGIVDAADYTVWRDLLGATGPGLPADGNGDNVVNDADYTYWKTRFGNSAGAGAAGLGANVVPEPTSLVLCAIMVALLGLGRGRRSSSLGVLRCAVVVAPILGIAFTSANCFAARTVDRLYRLGDEPSEGASLGQPLGSGNAFALTFDSVGTSGAGDLQDLSPVGTVNYANVSGRPFAGDSQLGASFNGGYLLGEFAIGAGGVGYPGLLPSPNPAADYRGITTRGMQLWVNPAPAGGGARQEIINDTYQFGLHITENNTWGMTWSAANAAASLGRDYDSNVPVNFNEWTHLHQHSFGNGRGVLYANGIAVASSQPGQAYSTGTAGIRDITVGANVTELGTNVFSGLLDDIEIYVAGMSGITSTNFGNFNLGEDNHYIAAQQLVPGDLNGDGVVNDEDVNIFLANWRNEQLFAGVRTGDLNSRSFGDFNYDGIVDLADWHILRSNHVNGQSLNLGQLLAGVGATVPEPATCLLLLLGLAAMSLLRARRRASATRLCIGGLALAAGTLMAGSTSASGLWNVDFQGDTNGTLFGQEGVAKNYGPDASGIWNHFSVPALSTNPQLDFAIDPSLNLVDSTGAAGPVTVTLHGQHAGWNGGANSHPLFGDYVILLGNGALGFPPPPTDMTITGLMPGVDYSLRIISGNVSAVRDLAVTIDADGNGSLDNDATVVAPSGGVGTTLSFTASGAGSMIGRIGLNTANEANLAGLQIKIGDFEPVLTIDRNTGEATLSNRTAATLNMTGYSILSPSGALDPSQWLSITDNYDASSATPTVDPNSDWFKFSQPSDRDNLSEAQAIGGNGATFSHEQVIELGNFWIRNPTQDVSMQMLLEDGTLQDVRVEYTGSAPIIGDMNNDGVVDLADWVLFKTGFSTDLTGLSAAERFGFGDFNMDGVVDLADANLFASAFDSMNGSGAWQAVISGSHAVPEPSAAILLLLGIAAAAGCRERSAGGRRTDEPRA